MSIYTIATLERVEEIMRGAYLYYADYHPIIFDLVESINPMDVKVSISQCGKCKSIVHFKLDEENEGCCPHCGQPMTELVAVQMIIQGEVVLSTNYRPVETRLRDIRDAVAEYDRQLDQAATDRSRGERLDEAHSKEAAKRALELAVRLSLGEEE